MYIRKVLKKNKNGTKTYESHQLVETIRTEKGIQQKLLLSLGRLSLSKDKWSRLAKLIESIIQNQTILIHEDPEIEKLAQKYALEFINKHFSPWFHRFVKISVGQYIITKISKRYYIFAPRIMPCIKSLIYILYHRF